MFLVDAPETSVPVTSIVESLTVQSAELLNRTPSRSFPVWERQEFVTREPFASLACIAVPPSAVPVTLTSSQRTHRGSDDEGLLPPLCWPERLIAGLFFSICILVFVT